MKMTIHYFLKGGSDMALKPRQLQLIEALMANPMIPDTELAK